MTLETVTEPMIQTQLLPDPPSADESIPAPFDLPLPERGDSVSAIRVKEFLPEPFQLRDEDLRP